MSTTIQTCEVCKLSHQPPTKYLLVCSQCSTGYHHRCCNPPMNDAQLASLVRASKKNKPGKGLAAWKCGPCVKGKGKDAVGEQPTRSSAAGKEKLIIELLDDEVDAPVTVTATSTRTEHFVEIQNSTASQDLAISNPDSNDQAGP
ncbi:hypothetical protein BD410DRAFT_64395 [Rickenella mellea]|uniref:Zinc finger PHD-type domain-containing protein n=1 Tax=Rickenella mellea TaxID=50990 RepID=A0A4Y7QCM7_9AGAM|nr:hypothetical protein BD410DRAFT_64395 [Rickenella mellea]